MADSDQDRIDRDSEREGERDYSLEQRRRAALTPAQRAAEDAATKAAYDAKAPQRAAKERRQLQEQIVRQRKSWAAQVEAHARAGYGQDSPEYAAAYRKFVVVPFTRLAAQARTMGLDPVDLGVPQEVAAAAASMAGAPTTASTPPAGQPTATPPVAANDPYGAFMAVYKGSKQEKAYGAISQDMLNSNEFLEQLPNELFRLLPSARLESFSTQRLAKLPNEDIMALVRFNPNLVGGFGADFWSKRGFPQDFMQGEIIPHLERTDQVGLAGEIKNAAAAMAGAPEVPAAAPGGAGGGTTAATPTAPTVAGPVARQAGYDIRGPQAVNAGQSRDALDMFLNLQGIAPPPQTSMVGAPSTVGMQTQSLVGAPGSDQFGGINAMITQEPINQEPPIEADPGPVPGGNGPPYDPDDAPPETRTIDLGNGKTKTQLR